MKHLQGIVAVFVTVLVIGGGAYFYLRARSSASEQRKIVRHIGTAEVETICTLGGNNISEDESSYYNSLTFFARGEACATVSGKDTGRERVTFNGVTSEPFEYVQLAFYDADFSPDGRRFVYTASNVPLNSVLHLTSTGERADWKPQRFIVADNKKGPVYDDIYRPQYSPDGAHLGYCGYKGGVFYGDGVYVKVIDDKETGTTNKITDCESLFGQKEEIKDGWHVISPDGSLKMEAYFDPEDSASTHCLMANCRVYLSLINAATNEKIKTFSSFGTVSQSVFSPDSKHYAFFGDPWVSIRATSTEPSSIIIDGEKRPAPFVEIFNMNFSADSKTLHYNAREGNEVYYVVEPVGVQ